MAFPRTPPTMLACEQMRFLFTFGTVVSMAAVCLLAQQQSAVDQEQQASQTRGMPARATPGDYQAHGQAGKVTVAAEFFQHTIPSPQGILDNADFVIVEAALFGPSGTRLTMSYQDFSLRLNAKKNPLASEPYSAVFKALRDPEWEAPEEAAAKKSGKGGISTDGKTPGGNDPPPIVHVPIELQRQWNARVVKDAFPEGDRTLPQAGLLFFRYGGKASGIHSLELTYSGAGGKVTLKLNP
jgi:hypothetical protein